MKNRIMARLAALASLLCMAAATSLTRAGEAGAELKWPPMPEGVMSFAATTLRDFVYACGGHKGDRHEYSAEMVSGSFFRLNLAGGQAWEKLPEAPPAQGAPLTAHGNYLYRTGGMAARNAAGQKQDLWSITNVIRFNSGTCQWEDFVALPEARSSHDAVVLGNQLYVGGGWDMLGADTKPKWFDTLLSVDLSDPKAGWKSMPQPFQRRALAMAVQDGKIYFIGGMDSDNKATLAVEVYDPKSGAWTPGPALPEGKFKGFSCAAISQGGRIYANAFQGDLLRLSADGKAWETVGRLQHPRMAHRLVTAGESQVIALGGEDGDAKRPDLEVFTTDMQVQETRKQAAAVQN